MWGQEAIRIIISPKHRIIPTRMGTRKKDGRDILYNKDHPHAYGDKYTRDFRRAAQLESSPRVWGQVRILAFVVALARIIPTRMGTREACTSSQRRKQDHPHAYGDKSVGVNLRTM